MDRHRLERFREQLRLELAELIEQELADPRLGSLTVAAVHLSGDGKTARVLVAPGEEQDEAAVLRGLDHARSFLRHALAQRMDLRHVPQLVFAVDHGQKNADRVETLLERLHKRKQLGVLLLLCCLPARSDWVRHEASAHTMGSVFTIAAYGEDRRLLTAAVEAAFQEARRIDQLLSHYRASSELSEVNREAGRRPVRVSPEFFDLLQKCYQYSEASEGAFDWTVGALMKVWGFYRGEGRQPESARIEQALRLTGYQKVHLDPEERTVRFEVEGLELDPGGIGKGYAVDRMVEVLQESGVESALVTAAGSSIYGLGAPPHEPGGWRVRIRDPQSEAVTAAEVYLKDLSLSTSGTYEKFFEAEGRKYSHIMDPRTGWPARGMLAVSVLAPLTLDSEAWTKPFFVQGAEWTRKHAPAGFRVLLCEESKPCYWAP